MKTWSMEKPNGKRKPRRFSLIHLSFAHRANGSLSSYPFANGQNELKGLVHLLDFNIGSVVNSKENGAAELIYVFYSVVHSVNQQAHEAIVSCQAKRGMAYYRPCVSGVLLTMYAVSGGPQIMYAVSGALQTM